MASDPELTPPPPKPAWKPLLIALVVGLVLWGSYLAVGAWLGGMGRGNVGADWRRGMVVLACVLGFVGILWFAMHSRQPPQDESKDD